MKIGPKVGLLVAGLVAAQVVTVAGSGYLIMSEGREFGALAGLVSLGLTLASLVFAAFMTARIVGPVRRLTHAAQRVAGTELPQTLDRIRRSTGDVETPTLARLNSGTEGDESEILARALNDLQDSAVALAAETRRKELAAAEILVNLAQRNQSLLNRTLSYIGELERNERDPQVRAHLIRLEHLTTRIRRNAESMRVLAGAEQAFTHTKPVPMFGVARAALAEIEDYGRVRVGTLGGVAVHGPHAADLSHLLAELLENATRFSQRESPVLLQGAPTEDGYRFIVRDHGLGMSDAYLRVANRTIATAEESDISAKLIGLHVIGRLAARHGVSVQLRNGEVSGCVAVIDLPTDILVKTDVEERAQAEAPTPAVEVAEPAPEAEAPQAEIEAPQAEVAEPAAPRSLLIPAPRPGNPASQVPRRRVRGAQLPDLGDSGTPELGQRDADLVGRQLAGLQSSVARARRESSEFTEPTDT